MKLKMMKSIGTKSTYKELKLNFVVYFKYINQSTKSTYKELKHTMIGGVKW